MLRQHKKATIFIAGLCLLVSTQAGALSTRESLDQINQRLDRIEQILESQGLLDMLQQLETLQQEVSQLRGEIEVQNHSLEQLKERQRALYTDIDQRLQRLESGKVAVTATLSETGAEDTADSSEPPLQTLQPVIAEPDTGTQQTGRSLTIELISDEPVAVEETPPPSQAVVNEAETTTETMTSETAVAATVEQEKKPDPIRARADYEQAFGLLKKSLYDQAIKAFHQFLSVHPDSEYSDNAQYWLAEAYYVTDQYEQALTEYNNLITNHPDSQKLTQALLKIAYSNYELGQVEEAKAQLEEITQKYPGTTAARLARERLIKINSTQAAQPGNTAN